MFARRNKLPLKLQLRLREFARFQRVTRSLQVGIFAAAYLQAIRTRDPNH